MAGFVEEWKTLNNSLNKKKGVDRKYWLYAPGENANKWDEFRNEGIMALGWDELGDLNHYDGKKEIAERLRQLENTESSKKNDASANYDIFKTIEIGDVIIVKKGVKEYLGYGVVESEYFYDDDREEFKSCRKVDWKSKPDSYWKQVLTPLQYYVTREEGTEKPFTGEYDKHYIKGTYICSNCGLALFSRRSSSLGHGFVTFINYYV